MENKNLVVADNKEMITVNTLNQFGKDFYDRNKNYIEGKVLVTEDNLKDMKVKRAEFNKTFNENESLRKMALAELDKSRIELMNAYKPNVTEYFSKIDKNLKESIDLLEDKQKQDKKDKVESYFNELKELHALDFLTFDKIGLNVTLSVSEKKLREEALDFVNRVLSDLELIDTQTHAKRIKVRYITNMNVSQAIQTVTEEVKHEEKLLHTKLEAEQDTEVNTKIEKPLSKPIIKEETMKVQFTVTATRTQIVKLKEIMETEGIVYE